MFAKPVGKIVDPQGRSRIGMRGHDKPVKLDVYVSPFYLSKDIKVYLVDRNLVRKQYYKTFVEGGHDRIYAFIPKGEIWIDSKVSNRKKMLVTLHEAIERNEMGKGIGYNKAHRKANGVESYFKREPSGLLERMIEEMS